MPIYEYVRPRFKTEFEVGPGRNGNAETVRVRFVQLKTEQHQAQRIE